MTYIIKYVDTDDRNIEIIDYRIMYGIRDGN